MEVFGSPTRAALRRGGGKGLLEGLPTVLFQEFCCERWRARDGVFAGGESGVQGFAFFLEDRRLTAGFMLMGITQWGGKT